VIASVLTGAILLALTLFFNVNPVEGSVVNDAIRGTPLHYVLLVTTMPAWIAGSMIFFPLEHLIDGEWAVWAVLYPLMFIIQVAIYAGIALLLRWIVRTIFRRKR